MDCGSHVDAKNRLIYLSAAQPPNRPNTATQRNATQRTQVQIHMHASPLPSHFSSPPPDGLCAIFTCVAGAGCSQLYRLS